MFFYQLKHYSFDGKLFASHLTSSYTTGSVNFSIDNNYAIIETNK